VTDDLEFWSVNAGPDGLTQISVRAVRKRISAGSRLACAIARCSGSAAPISTLLIGESRVPSPGVQPDSPFPSSPTRLAAPRPPLTTDPNGIRRFKLDPQGPIPDLPAPSTTVAALKSVDFGVRRAGSSPPPRIIRQAAEVLKVSVAFLSGESSASSSPDASLRPF
jgi:hypothetical protein